MLTLVNILEANFDHKMSKLSLIDYIFWGILIFEIFILLEHYFLIES